MVIRRLTLNIIAPNISHIWLYVRNYNTNVQLDIYLNTVMVLKAQSVKM